MASEIKSFVNHMIYKYKISIKQQLLLLWQPIFPFLIVIGVGKYYFGFSLSETPFYFTCGFIFITDTIPALILHIQYLINNLGSELIIDTENRKLLYKKINGNINNDIYYQFSDIKSLKYYASFGRSSGVNSFARYRYCKIFLVNKNEIVITCLMINDIENTLEKVLHIKPEKEFRFYCFV
jgi:hypothetical protein